MDETEVKLRLLLKAWRQRCKLLDELGHTFASYDDGRREATRDCIDDVEAILPERNPDGD